MKTVWKSLIAWVVIIATLAIVALFAGGRNCEVPKSGPLHWLLQGREYKPTNARTFRAPACRRVK